MRWIVLLTLTASLTLSETAWAQLPRRSRDTRTYEPSRQRFSNYLNLLRTDTGPLPNYQQFLRRDQNLSRDLHQLNRGIKDNKRDTLELNRQFSEDLEQRDEELVKKFPSLQILAPRMRPTGTGSQFMRYRLQYSGGFHRTR